MRFILKLLTILFVTGYISACLTQKATAESTEKKFAHLISKAELGDVNAQIRLAIKYYFGQGIPKDNEQAVYWFTKAAKQGDTDAQYLLGTMYDSGQGIPENEEMAVYWYTKA